MLSTYGCGVQPSFSVTSGRFLASESGVKWSMTPGGVEYPSGQWEAAVPVVSPHNSFCTPSPLAGVRSRNSMSAVTKHPCIVNTVSSPNTKHSPTLPAMKKMNSVPAKTSTEGYLSLFPLETEDKRLSSDFRGVNSLNY